MCSNYEPVTASDRLLSFFGVVRGPDELPFEFQLTTWPTGLAPIVRLDRSGRRVADAAHFGLVPHFAREVIYGRKTYNARSETVHSLPSFRAAWARGQRCIVPAEAIFENCWETGKAVRWRIHRPGGVPMGIAGIYVDHPTMKGEDGKPLVTFSMLTVNAFAHPVFSRMHKPEDEKRMVVILDQSDYDRWLTCSNDEAREFFRQWPGVLEAHPAPLPARAPAAKKTARRLVEPDGDIGQGDLL